jgi:hypothetical protein
MLPNTGLGGQLVGLHDCSTPTPAALLIQAWTASQVLVDVHPSQADQTCGWHSVAADPDDQSMLRRWIGF